jgi:hypothetical protein
MLGWDCSASGIAVEHECRHRFLYLIDPKGSSCRLLGNFAPHFLRVLWTILVLELLSLGGFLAFVFGNSPNCSQRGYKFFNCTVDIIRRLSRRRSNKAFSPCTLWPARWGSHEDARLWSAERRTYPMRVAWSLWPPHSPHCHLGGLQALSGILLWALLLLWTIG